MLLDNGKFPSDSNPVPTKLIGSIVEESGGDERLKVTLATTLSKDTDSIDVGKMSKGGVVAFASVAVDTTTAEVNCRGYNAIKVWIEITGTGTWTVAIKDCATSGGTFVDSYDGSTKHEIAGITSSRSILFRGIGDYVKIYADETADGATCVIKVQPLNV